MHTLLKKALIPSVLLALTASCKHEDKKSDLESEVSGSATNLPSDLGVGFDSDTQVIKSQCVTGTPVWRGAQDSSIEYGQDLSFNDIVKSYGGGAKVGATVYGFDVKGAAEFASKNASTEYSSNLTLVNKITLKKLVLANPRLTAQGEAEMSDGRARDTVRETCGNEYFNEIEYGAQLFVVAKFDFASAQDKIEFKGNASVSLLGIGELGGSISHLSDKVKKSGRVTITARQVGGNPEDLSSILSSGVITCSLVDFEKTCLPALTAIVKYASEDFRKSLSSLPDPQTLYEKELAAGSASKNKTNPGNAKGWAEVNFITAKYSDVKIGSARLVPEIDIPLVNADITKTRAQVYDDFQIALNDAQRATDLLRDPSLSDLKRKQILAIESATNKNRDALATVGTTCMAQPAKCIEAYRKYKAEQMKSYDSRQLSFGICLIKSDLDDTSWNYLLSEKAAPVAIKLNASGTVANATDKDTKTWKVDGCILRFYNDAGTATTVFGKIDDSGTTMSGPGADESTRTLNRKS